MQASATYSHSSSTLFYGGAAVADYYGEDNNNYVAGEGFCCGDNNLKTKSIADDSPNYEKLQYYYHSDHLGSASYITNLDGEVVQHIEYVPFGEVFLEERNDTWNTPFLFNGKELDEETGLYYYGARYYNPRISLWYGVDPLAEKYPAHSPYCYTMNNPIMLVDPDGRIIKPAPGSRQEFIKNYNEASAILIAKGVGGSLNQLINSAEVYLIQESVKSTYDTATKTINWNPSVGLEVDGKVVLSPTGALGHEIEHSKRHDDAISAWYSGDQNAFYDWMDSLQDYTSDNYKDMDEEIIITGPEQRIAKALGSIGENETTRDAFVGKPVRVDGINSTNKLQAPQKMETKKVDFQTNTPEPKLELK